MHDIEANFEKILPIIKETLLDQLNAAPFAFLVSPNPHYWPACIRRDPHFPPAGVYILPTFKKELE